MISAVEGITEITRQHAYLAFTLKVHVIVLITKIDLISEEKLMKIRDDVKTLLKSPPISRINFVIKSNEDVTTATNNFEENIVPIIFMSNKTGKGLDLLISLLQNLPYHKDWNDLIKESPEFHISHAVIGEDGLPLIWGVVYRGTIKLKERMQLGPTNDGKFMYF